MSNTHPHFDEIDTRLRNNVRELVEHHRPPSLPGKQQGNQIRYGRKHGLAVDVLGTATGLSVGQTWGRETWIALGSVGKLVDTVAKQIWEVEKKSRLERGSVVQ
jgi:hypothetical protein